MVNQVISKLDQKIWCTSRSVHYRRTCWYDTLCGTKPCIARVLFVDFSKAFDGVGHTTVIINKLIEFGIHGPVIKQFASFLINRQQRVKIGNLLLCPSNPAKTQCHIWRTGCEEVTSCC